MPEVDLLLQDQANTENSPAMPGAGKMPTGMAMAAAMAARITARTMRAVKAPSGSPRSGNRAAHGFHPLVVAGGLQRARRRRIWTSTVRSSMKTWSPQTSSSNWARV